MTLHSRPLVVVLVASSLLACSPEPSRPVDPGDLDDDDGNDQPARIIPRDAGDKVVVTTPPSPEQPTEKDAAVTVDVSGRPNDAGADSAQDAVSMDPRPTPGGGSVVIAAAGDIAASGSGPALQTATLLRMLVKARGISAILTMGDNAYPDGAVADFRDKFAPTWGHPEIKPLLRPVPGNHDYHVSGAGPYYDYFGGAAGPRGKGFYSYNVGSWHIIALNSNDECKLLGCGPGSEQHSWLLQDLAANKTKCTLAYWHHPRFQQGTKHGDSRETAPLWDALYDAQADVVLTGHDHNFQQFGPMNKAGELDRARGIRSFVVGTGGATLYKSFSSAHNSALEYKQATDFGVLEMTLGPESYEWRFISVKGAEMVKGKDVCR